MPLTVFARLWGKTHRDGDAGNGGDDPPDRRGKRRRSDWLELGAIALAIVLWTATAFILSGQVRRFHRDEKQRITDLRANCLRSSVDRAADVNLNWVYYQSEVQLGGSSAQRRRFAQRASALPAAERSFFLALLAGGTSRRVLEVRADADFDAAFIKAHQIDVSQAGLVAVRTALGPAPQPRRWVYAGGFSCKRAFTASNS